jgi:hypothetical protein
MLNTEAPHVNRPEGEELTEGEFKGLLVKKVSSANTTSVIALDSRYCRDASRWEVMPSVETFPDLVRLDLHKSRYITAVHASVAELQKLQHLGLTRCTRLQELPPTIGRLQNLQVVGNTVRYGLAHVPEPHLCSHTCPSRTLIYVGCLNPYYVALLTNLFSYLYIPRCLCSST